MVMCKTSNNMIIFLCSSGIGFPNGTASTGRVRNYAKGLTELGKKIYIMLLTTSEYGNEIVNTQTVGEINGIRFEYTCGQTIRGKTLLLRRWLILKGVLVAAMRVLALSKNTYIEALIMYPELPFSTTFFWLLSRIINCPLLLEKSEHPFYQAGAKEKGKFYKAFYTLFVYKRFDGVMVISNFLEEFMKTIVHAQSKIIKIPIFVDFENFQLSVSAESRTRERNITYCGLLNEAKDGVKTLMKAYKLIAGEFPDVQLHLVGDSYTNSRIPEFKAYAKVLGIVERVTFIGMVRREEVPKYLNEASVLALARPDSLQAKAGFPSKVGEYLASGKPAVVTLTGELTDYLEDGVSIFFANADDVEDFAERLRYVLKNYSEAQKVGLNGQAIAHKFFNYKSNMERFVSYIESLCNLIKK